MRLFSLPRQKSQTIECEYLTGQASIEDSKKQFMIIRNDANSKKIGFWNAEKSPTDEGRQSTEALYELQTLLYLGSGKKADNQKTINIKLKKL